VAKGLEAALDELGMLLGQERGGAEHKHLPACLCHAEDGAHRHLCLPKPHIACHTSHHGTESMKKKRKQALIVILQILFFVRWHF